MTTVTELSTDPSDFDQELRDWTNDTAPRMFAVVSVWTDDDGEQDAQILAWGMEFEDGRAQVIGDEDGRHLMKLRSAERAVWWYSRFTREAGVTIQLVWMNRAVAT
jgi:hypothetical protein